MSLPEAEKKAQRESLAAGPLSTSLDHLQSRLVAHGGQYFADGRLTVADLKVFSWIRHLRSGQLDHVPVDLPARVAPRLVEHYERVKEHPAIKAYYTAREVAL
jgi:glutathione S-transferase